VIAMNDIAIRVENLSKLYKIGQTVGYSTIRESLTNVITAPFRSLRQIGDRRQKTEASGLQSSVSSPSNTIWALKDVSFEVKRGEAVGIIGRNGSGKSTLLKILSRITAPTEGRVEIRGRVGSLLEVGTGFHPELTGRQNMYLNGAVLGMKRAEVERKFDEIVAFAEIEKFLDTPVKRYSSGMYVRLAFSVAAHLEPDILLIDEVLAVGDAEFQKKCLGKMGEVTGEGRTVLFVSHNMAAINALCQKCVLLQAGRAVHIGDVKEVISDYQSKQYESSDADIDLTNPSLRRNSLENSLFKWTHIKILNSQGVPTTSIKLMEPFDLIITGILKEPVENLVFGFGVMSAMGFSLFNSHTTDTDLPKNYSAGKITFNVKFDPDLLGPGIYTIDLGANGPGVIDWIPEAAQINVEQVSLSGYSLRMNYGGVIVYPCKWSLAYEHTTRTGT